MILGRERQLFDGVDLGHTGLEVDEEKERFLRKTIPRLQEQARLSDSPLRRDHDVSTGVEELEQFLHFSRPIKKVFAGYGVADHDSRPSHRSHRVGHREAPGECTLSRSGL